MYSHYSGDDLGIRIRSGSIGSERDYKKIVLAAKRREHKKVIFMVLEFFCPSFRANKLGSNQGPIMFQSATTDPKWAVGAV